MHIDIYAACLALACTTWFWYKRVLLLRQRDRAAPVVGGLPLIGNTISLALHGAKFVHRCRLEVCAPSQPAV